MKICPKCGLTLEDEALFCSECGTKLESEEPKAEEPKTEEASPEEVKTEEAPKNEPVEEKEPIIIETPTRQTPPPPPPPKYEPDPAPAPTSRYAPVSPWRYVGIFVLLGIPLVGFVCTIVWACGGAHRVNVRNFARGILLCYLISLAVALLAIIVTAIVAIATGAALLPVLEDLFYEIIYSIF